MSISLYFEKSVKKRGRLSRWIIQRGVDRRNIRVYIHIRPMPLSSRFEKCPHWDEAQLLRKTVSLYGVNAGFGIHLGIVTCFLMAYSAKYGGRRGHSPVAVFWVLRTTQLTFNWPSEKLTTMNNSINSVSNVWILSPRNIFHDTK